MAFGSGTQTSYTNYTIPHIDNVTNMVGLFWDDLFEGSSNPTSKLLYYNDVPNHRFIVEWDSVGHYGGTSLRETFQAILLNPVYYPTPTGDGEIILQYRIVGEEGGCTVGFEDSTQTIGMQYLYNSTYDLTATDIRDGVAIKFTTKSPHVVVSVGEQKTESERVPSEFTLEQNYPNPFNPTTVIRYGLPVESRVSLKVYDVLGQEVCTLVDEVQTAGHKSVQWDSKTGRGFQAASGVYFTRLDVKGVNGSVFSEVRKMLLMK
jgi:hypothetical protein